MWGSCLVLACCFCRFLFASTDRALLTLVVAYMLLSTCCSCSQLARRFWGPYQAWRGCEDSSKGLDEYAPGDVVLAYFLELIKDHPALVPLIRVDARVGRRQSSAVAASAKRPSDPPSWAPPPSDGTPNPGGGGAGAVSAEPHAAGDPMAGDDGATGGPLFTTGWPSAVHAIEGGAADAAATAARAAAAVPHQPPTPPPSSVSNGVGALSLPLVSAGPAGPAPGYPAADTDAAAVAAATAAATATLRASGGGGSGGLGKRPAAVGGGGGGGDYEAPPPKRHDSGGVGGGADHTAADLAAIASAYRSAKEAQAPLSIILMLEEKLREAACNVTTSR